jgi:hypothetical protein
MEFLADITLLLWFWRPRSTDFISLRRREGSLICEPKFHLGAPSTPRVHREHQCAETCEQHADQNETHPQYRPSGGSVGSSVNTLMSEHGRHGDSTNQDSTEKKQEPDGSDTLRLVHSCASPRSRSIGTIDEGDVTVPGVSDVEGEQSAT